MLFFETLLFLKKLKIPANTDWRAISPVPNISAAEQVFANYQSCENTDRDSSKRYTKTFFEQYILGLFGYIP